MVVSSNQKIGLLLFAQDSGKKVGLAVLGFLRQLVVGEAQVVVDGGRTRVSVSTGGVSTNFTIPGGSKTLAPPVLMDCFVELWSLYQTAMAQLGGTPTDDQVVAQMVVYLRPIKGYTDAWQWLSK